MLRNIVFNDWFTILLMACLILVSVSKLFYAKRFSDFVRLIGNSNYLKIYNNNQKFVNTFDSLLFFNLIISLSIFIVLSINVYSGTDHSQNIKIYYKLIIGISSLFIIKVMIDRLLGSLFEINELINIYVFNKITIKNFIGLIILPLNILLIFSINPTKTIINAIFLLIIAINIIGFSMSFKSNLKAVKNNLFYFILYLCALEIAPYLILYKVFKSF